MKKTYIKPQLCVMATATDEHLLYTSWAVDRKNGDELGKDDYGKIIYDKDKYEEGEYDPWKDTNW